MVFLSSLLTLNSGQKNLRDANMKNMKKFVQCVYECGAFIHNVLQAVRLYLQFCLQNLMLLLKLYANSLFYTMSSTHNTPDCMTTTSLRRTRWCCGEFPHRYTTQMCHEVINLEVLSCL